MKIKKWILTEFATGLIIGFVTASLVFGVAITKYFFDQEKKEIIENAKRQQAIEELREEISNLDYFELLDSMPGVRGAADDAASEFERKRDEALQRFRSRVTDR